MNSNHGIVGMFAGKEEFGIKLLTLLTAIFFAWLGYLKFLPYEAEAVSGLMMSNPLTSWLINLFGTTGGPAVIGGIEIICGALLFIGLGVPAAGFAGAAIACVSLFVTTTMLFAVPVFQADLGFPALSGLPGQFLAKDPLLLASSFLLLVNFAGKLINRPCS